MCNTYTGFTHDGVLYSGWPYHCKMSGKYKEVSTGEEEEGRTRKTCLSVVMHVVLLISAMLSSFALGIFFTPCFEDTNNTTISTTVQTTLDGCDFTTVDIVPIVVAFLIAVGAAVGVIIFGVYGCKKNEQLQPNRTKPSSKVVDDTQE